MTPGYGLPYGPREVCVLIREYAIYPVGWLIREYAIYPYSRVCHVPCVVTRKSLSFDVSRMRCVQGPTRIGHDSLTRGQLDVIGQVCLWSSVVGPWGAHDAPAHRCEMVFS